MNPIEKFAELLERARQAGLPEPTAAAVATADAAGRPSVRMLLLKGFDEQGFVSYTNLGSRKARELAENPRASACFFWAALEIQVRVEGAVTPVTAEEADAYFATRPRGSQIGAWASKQSEPLPSREELETRIAEVEARHEGAEISRPPFWSGFRIAPERVELWFGRSSRLHEREVYRPRAEGGWSVERLYP